MSKKNWKKVFSPTIISDILMPIGWAIVAVLYGKNWKEGKSELFMFVGYVFIAGIHCMHSIMKFIAVQNLRKEIGIKKSLANNSNVKDSK